MSGLIMIGVRVCSNMRQVPKKRARGIRRGPSPLRMIRATAYSRSYSAAPARLRLQIALLDRFAIPRGCCDPSPDSTPSTGLISWPASARLKSMSVSDDAAEELEDSHRCYPARTCMPGQIAFGANLDRSRAPSGLTRNDDMRVFMRVSTLPDSTAAHEIDDRQQDHSAEQGDEERRDRQRCVVDRAAADE